MMSRSAVVNDFIDSRSLASFLLLKKKFGTFPLVLMNRLNKIEAAVF